MIEGTVTRMRAGRPDDELWWHAEVCSRVPVFRTQMTQRAMA